MSNVIIYVKLTKGHNFFDPSQPAGFDQMVVEGRVAKLTDTRIFNKARQSGRFDILQESEYLKLKEKQDNEHKTFVEDSEKKKESERNESKKKANSILQEAKAEASEILSQVKDEASKIIEDAKSKAEEILKAAEELTKTPTPIPDQTSEVQLNDNKNGSGQKSK